MTLWDEYGPFSKQNVLKKNASSSEISIDLSFSSEDCSVENEEKLRCRVTDDHVVDLLSESITSINLDACSTVSDFSVFAIIERCPRLNHLSIGSTQITNEAIIAIANTYFRLKYLHIGDVNISSEGIHAITTGLKQLEELDISNNKITDASFAEIVKNCSKIQNLYASECGISKLPDNIGTLLPELRRLDLEKNNITRLPESLTSFNNYELFFVADNPLREPPLSIALMGAEAIKNYFTQCNISTTSLVDHVHFQYRTSTLLLATEENEINESPFNDPMNANNNRPELRPSLPNSSSLSTRSTGSFLGTEENGINAINTRPELMCSLENRRFLPAEGNEISASPLNHPIEANNTRPGLTRSLPIRSSSSTRLSSSSNTSSRVRWKDHFDSIDFALKPVSESNSESNSVGVYIHPENQPTVVSSTLVDEGVDVSNKRFHIKKCGFLFCDDSFKLYLNPKLYILILAIIVAAITTSVILLLKNPLRIPIPIHSEAPSIFSPLAGCIMKYPDMNHSLIGDGICNGGEYLDEVCLYDGGDCIPSIEFVGDGNEELSKWSDFILTPDGYMYGIPWDNDHMLRFNSTTNETRYLGKNKGEKKWSACVIGLDGAIYGVPYHAESVLRYDPALDDFSYIVNKKSILFGEKKYYGGVQGKDGNLYFMPHSRNEVAILLYPYNESIQMSGTLQETQGSFRGGVDGGDGYIYGIPFNGKRVSRINAFGMFASTFGTKFPGQQKWSNGVLASNGHIYACPYSANRVLKIDREEKSASLVGPTFESEGKWSDFVEGPDKLLYGIPYNSDSLLIFDPHTETGTMIPMGELFGNMDRKWSAGVLGMNNIIYAVPSDHSQILAITPNNMQRAP